MGLLDGTTQQAYYTTPSDYGNYQFVTLDNVIKAFMISYVGAGKIISKVSRTEVQFHAMRAFQELSYDVFRSVKTQEISVPNNLAMIMPQDYVNYVKLTRVGTDGIERILYPTSKTSNPVAISQESDGSYIFDHNKDGDVLDAGEDSLAEVASTTLSNFQSTTSTEVNSDDADNEETYLDAMGRRYGLDPQHAQSNGTFYIDYQRGRIHFSSGLAGITVILHYISDGLGTDSEMMVHKFCENAIYKHIAYAVVAAKSNIPEYVVARFKKEKFAETRKAKLRLSNIKIEEFAQTLKGMSKHIK